MGTESEVTYGGPKHLQVLEGLNVRGRCWQCGEVSEINIPVEATQREPFNVIKETWYCVAPACADKAVSDKGEHECIQSIKVRNCYYKFVAKYQGCVENPDGSYKKIPGKTFGFTRIGQHSGKTFGFTKIDHHSGKTWHEWDDDFKWLT